MTKWRSDCGLQQQRRGDREETGKRGGRDKEKGRRHGKEEKDVEEKGRRVRDREKNEGEGESHCEVHGCK